jgi:hypothetical protein
MIVVALVRVFVMIMSTFAVVVVMLVSAMIVAAIDLRLGGKDIE